MKGVRALFLGTTFTRGESTEGSGGWSFPGNSFRNLKSNNEFCSLLYMFLYFKQLIFNINIY